MSRFTNSMHPVLFIAVAMFSLSCTGTKEREQDETAKEQKAATAIENPVLPGDFADPSVIRVGEDYWATATSSEWAPLYPLLHSTDLKDWEIVSHVFPDSLPNWAEAHFWAPEIAYDNGKYYIYYTAKKKDGPLCVGVASSEDPTGPYKDHGPIVCQDAGAIDGFQIRDDEGKLFLIWKEDGNSRGEPTPMWGQEMNEERTELIGERFELFRNDPDTWEGNLVEGAYLLKKNGYYYTFYSGDACCGRECTYGIGVARARNLKGPWEKYEKNPLKKENEEWKCAGHGTMVQDEDGGYFFLYHAYNKDGGVYTGRQGLLSELVWREDDWPEFKETDSEKVLRNKEQDLNINESFKGAKLSVEWQWPVGTSPRYKLEGEVLVLDAISDQLGALLAQRSLSPTYEATTAVEVRDKTSRPGLAAVGDPNNALGISYSGDEVRVWKVRNGEEEEVAKEDISSGSTIYLKMDVEKGRNYRFLWSKDGENWNDLGLSEPLDGAFLPPWDRAVRIGLVNLGPTGAKASFEFLKVESKTP